MAKSKTQVHLIEHETSCALDPGSGSSFGSQSSNPLSSGGGGPTKLQPQRSYSRGDSSYSDADDDFGISRKSMYYGSPNPKAKAHCPILRVKLQLYREPMSVLFNGLFPMLTVNFGSILVSIPSELTHSDYLQQLENVLTVRA